MSWWVVDWQLIFEIALLYRVKYCRTFIINIIEILPESMENYISVNQSLITFLLTFEERRFCSDVSWSWLIRIKDLLLIWNVRPDLCPPCVLGAIKQCSHRSLPGNPGLCLPHDLHIQSGLLTPELYALACADHWFAFVWRIYRDLVSPVPKKRVQGITFFKYSWIWLELLRDLHEDR